MINILDKHKIIGVDLDGTMIPDSNEIQPWMMPLRNYIKRNKNTLFYLITFRPFPADEVEIEIDLKNNGYDVTDFIGMFKLPISLAMEMAAIEKLKKKGLIDHITEQEEEYLEWKGKVCNMVGASILIDDMQPWVINGCKKYNIEYCHPRQLINQKLKNDWMM